VLTAALAWQVAHTTLTTLLFGFGVLAALRCRPSLPIALMLLVLLAYFLLTVALAGLEAYWRFRSSHMPLLFTFAAVALGRLRPLSSARPISVGVSRPAAARP
jgi:hypothetical protein